MRGKRICGARSLSVRWVVGSILHDSGVTMGVCVCVCGGGWRGHDPPIHTMGTHWPPSIWAPYIAMPSSWPHPPRWRSAPPLAPQNKDSVTPLLHGGPIELFLVSSQCSATGVTKAVVCLYPVCEMIHVKEPLLLIGKSSPCGGSGFPLTIWMVLYHMCDA